MIIFRYSLATFLVTSLAILGLYSHFSKPMQERIHRDPVSSGRFLSPLGLATPVGSFPCNMTMSSDHRYIAVTDSGFREHLVIFDARSGKIVEDLKAAKGRGYYYGIKFRNLDGGLHLLVSTGTNGQIVDYPFDESTGQLEDGVAYTFFAKRGDGPLAGTDISSNGKNLYAAENMQTTKRPYNGIVGDYNIKKNTLTSISVPGYPLDVLSCGKYEFVSCERDGVVAVISGNRVVKTIKTGSNPTKLISSPHNRFVYVANSGSDTVSEISTTSLKVNRTFLVRPIQMNGLAGATPLGLALDGAGDLMVALGDLNAVAVVSLKSGTVEGMLPVGWYPTAVEVNPENSILFVANAKGTASRTTNGEKNGLNGKWGHYILNILQGSVSKIDLDDVIANLSSKTNEVLSNAKLLNTQIDDHFHNPGIKHVIYIIKENRTYDQVFGDIKEGNGDPSLCLFGKDITPNEHALVKRFTLLDNFYTCADVSADGWNWSTSGMINEYNARNTPNNYSGRQQAYNFEGEDNGVSNDLVGLNDVGKAPCGYLWDDAIRSHVNLRNYGFFVKYVSALVAIKTGQEADKKALANLTCADFRQFDLNFPDSDLFKREHFTFPHQLKAFGPHHVKCRIDVWKKEFDHDCKIGKMPNLELVRLMSDHTAGTETGNLTPSAMVADNDYAIGQLVQAVSHSRFWKSTCICILEDDSQDGYDHVDCHRSTALVISPYMEKNRHDSRFYNTDSMLRTIELLLGMKPMNSYDATSAPIGGFESTLVNGKPYNAIMPSRAIASQVNGIHAFGASVSNRIVDTYAEHTDEDLLLNPIIWGSVKGSKVPPPAIIGSPISKSDPDGDGD